MAYDRLTYNREYMRRQRSEHPEIVRKQLNEYNKRLRARILELLGGKCPCGFSDPRALQVDHVNGNGSEDRRVHGRKYTKEVIRSIEAGEGKYQLLCANCNWIKRYENKEYGRVVSMDSTRVVEATGM